MQIVPDKVRVWFYANPRHIDILFSLMILQRNPNVIYATDDSNSEEASVPSPDYITGGGGSGGRRDSVKMRIFNRLSGKRLADENERMVRRKLISNEELNESQDDRNNELALSEEDRAASYINVMVSCCSSHKEPVLQKLFNFFQKQI